MSTTIITSWLLTYLIHSTILLGAAWFVSRFLGESRLALQETLLRTALIGGLLTTTLQVGVGVEPIGGALAIDGLVGPDAVTAVSARNDGVTISVAAPNITLSTPPTVPDRVGGFWPIALLSLWGCGSLLALLVLGRSALDLRRLLNTRRFHPAGRLVERLATAMGLSRPVRLSTSAAITVPFATGIRQPEICCPERVCNLAIEHQTGLFAHELAHLARRDPAWKLLYRLGEAFLILQPLNRLVRRRLEEIAEHLTDERAVACTGNRLGLARCLVVVAHWGMSSGLGVPATAFAAGPRLDRRVRRLLEGHAATQDRRTDTGGSRPKSERTDERGNKESPAEAPKGALRGRAVETAYRRGGTECPADRCRPRGDPAPRRRAPNQGKGAGPGSPARGWGARPRTLGKGEAARRGSRSRATR